MIHIFLSEYDRHPCDRVCKENEKSMVCRYQFDVELYNPLSKVRCNTCNKNITRTFWGHIFCFYAQVIYIQALYLIVKSKTNIDFCSKRCQDILFARKALIKIYYFRLVIIALLIRATAICQIVYQQMDMREESFLSTGNF